MLLRTIISFFLLFSSCLTLSTCGGGGGGGSDYTPAAEMTVYVEPGAIDPGDRALVTANVWDVHPDGILLKIRYPLGLSYVKNSATLEIDGSRKAIVPDINQSDADYTYLVFAFTQSRFGEDGKKTGIIRLEILATTESITGHVEIDATIRDPDASVSSQFDINNPLFGAKDEDNITVSGPIADTTPTP